jgi:hypothetical protein
METWGDVSRHPVQAYVLHDTDERGAKEGVAVDVDLFATDATQLSQICLQIEGLTSAVVMSGASQGRRNSVDTSGRHALLASNVTYVKLVIMGQARLYVVRASDNP